MFIFKPPYFRLVNALTLMAIALLLLLNMPWYIAFAPVVPWTVLAAIGSARVGWSYYLRIYNSLKDKNCVALTYDDGPHPNTLPLLEVLAKYDVKATFFCIGKQVEKHPEIVEKILSEGHKIANHTYSHSYTLGIFSTKRLAKELKRTNQIIENLTGKRPRYFRPPFGVTNPNIARAIRRKQMKAVGWSIRTLDTVKTTEEVKIIVQKKLKGGDIILLHDRLDNCAALTEEIILLAQERGFRMSALNRQVI